MKYFYTDPLAAAWMAKHFGMEYDFSEHKFYGWTTEHQLPLEKYYIHPDSLHLLKLQIGDLVQQDSEYSFFVISEEDAKKLEIYEIIQRNGIPFMWPETEQ